MFKPAKPLKKPDDVEHGYNYALFLLNISMRTEGEIREKMTKRGYFPEIIDEVILRLKNDRYVNDENYAEMFIENSKRFKYYGQFVIFQRMLLKKIPKDLAKEKLAEFLTPEDEREIAKRYVEKEFGVLKEVKKLTYEEKQKVMRRLLSRGFTMNLAKSLVS